jgi:hypothetical protein
VAGVGSETHVGTVLGWQRRIGGETSPAPGLEPPLIANRFLVSVRATASFILERVGQARSCRHDPYP